MRERARRIARIVGVVSLLALALLVAVPAITGHPLVSYASSGSMEPTIGVFDVFFVNPAPRTIAVGDIIVYESITRGGPAVHRVVGGDEDGWYTQGDANPASDQDGAGEPVVPKARILGKVITRADGTPILIPDAGVSVVEAQMRMALLAQRVGGPRILMALAFLIVAIAAAVPAMLPKARRPPTTPMPRRQRAILRRLFPRGILGRHVGLALLLVLVGSTAWAASHARGEVPLTMVVVDDDRAADEYRAQAPGGALPREIRVGALGLLPTVAIVENEGHIEADGAPISIAAKSTTIVLVQQRAGDAIGLQRDSVGIWRYPAFLPPAMILALHELAPGAPYAAYAAIGLAVGALWWASLGIGRLPVARSLGIREEWL